MPDTPPTEACCSTCGRPQGEHGEGETDHVFIVKKAKRRAPRNKQLDPEKPGVVLK